MTTDSDFIDAMRRQHLEFQQWTTDVKAKRRVAHERKMKFLIVAFVTLMIVKFLLVFFGE